MFLTHPTYNTTRISTSGEVRTLNLAVATVLLLLSSGCATSWGASKVESYFHSVTVWLPTDSVALNAIRNSPLHAAWNRSSLQPVLETKGWDRLTKTGNGRYGVHITIPDTSPAFQVMQKHATLCWAAAVQVVLTATGITGADQSEICRSTKRRECPTDSTRAANDAILDSHPFFYAANAREIALALAKWNRGPFVQSERVGLGVYKPANTNPAFLIQDLSENHPFILGLVDSRNHIGHTYVVTGMVFRPYGQFPVYTPFPLVLDTIYVFDPSENKATHKPKGFLPIAADTLTLNAVKLIVRSRP